MSSATAPAAERSARPGPGLILLLGALSGLGPFALDVYLPALPALSRNLHASATYGQLTLTAAMIGIAVGQLIGGPIADAHGRRRPLLTAMVVFTLASLGCALAGSMAPLIGLRLLQGVAGGFAAVIARTIVRDHYGGAAAARKYAALMAISGIAPLIAPIVGGLLLKFTDWRGEFVLLAALGAIITLACVVIARESLPESERHRGGIRQTLTTFATLLHDRSFIPYVLAFSISFGSMFAYIAASAFVLENVYGVTPQLYGVIFAVGEAGFALVAAAGGRLLNYFTAKQLMRAGLIGVAATSVVILVVALAGLGLWALLPALFIQLSCQGLTLSNGVAVAMTGQQQYLGSASALLGFTQFAAGAITAPLVGIGGADTAVPMGVVMCACGLVALVIGLTRHDPA